MTYILEVICFMRFVNFLRPVSGRVYYHEIDAKY